MSSQHTRTTIRTIAVAALAPIVAASITLVGSPANAAWTAGASVHGASTQVCKVRVDGGYRIKVRLDNRLGKHTHVGGLSRSRNGTTVRVNLKAPRGRVSATKALLWKPGYQLSVGIGELDGRGLGGGVTPSGIAQC